MVKSKGFDWDRSKNRDSWAEQPAEEMYYVVNRWKEYGLGKVLDLGCGLGRHSVFLANMGFAVEAFDISQEAISSLKSRSKDMKLSITVKQGDMLSLPYESEVFDYLVAYHVIYHTDKKGIEFVAEEMKRVLKPGGEVFVTFNSTSSPQLSNPEYKRIAPNTIVKTDGIEENVPHYYADEKEVRRLMADFEFQRFYHKEDIGLDWRGCHYYLLATKPTI